MLLEHNIKVFNDLEEILKYNNCCCVIMGTGVGKTYVALEYLNTYNYKALVVSPRYSINESWEKHTDKVETITYQKLARIYRDIDYSNYDIVICDEVHHIGAPKWGAPIKYLIDNNIIKVIGLTESSIRYSDGGRDVAKEFFKNNIAIGESVPSAIKKNILNPVTYVGAMYNSDGLKKTIRGKIQSRLYAKLNLVLNKTPTVSEILQKNMPEGKRKGIIFASTITDIKSAIIFVKSVYPDVPIKMVHSKQTQIHNDKVFEWFKNIDEGYLCSVDMISEGVHIDGVNTLIMLRRTESVNLFNQQLGRCLSASSKEPAILFDLVNNKYSIKIVHNKLRIKTNSIFNSKQLNIIPSEQLIIKDYTKDIIDVLAEIQKNLEKRWTEEEDKLLLQFYTEHPNGRGLKEFIKNYLPNRTTHGATSRAKYLGFIKVKSISYTDEEKEIIKKYYPTEGPACYKRLINRTKEAVIKCANALGIICNRFWTESELKLLKKYYPIEGSKAIRHFPNRTNKDIASIARRYGIKYNHNNWTDEELEIIKNNYGKIKTDDLCKLLPNRTRTSIQACAVNNLKIRFNYPKVRCIETGQIFKNAREAGSILVPSVRNAQTHISACCRGIKKSAYGYHWEYIKENK